MNKAPKLFISYRREDTRGDAGRLNDTLNQLLGLGNTFFDFEGIAPGRDFEIQLKGALDQVKFLLVLVGPRWETIADSFGKLRLEKHDDYVRNEVLAGLESKNLQVVPILFNRHSIPDAKDLPEVLRPLVKRQAFEIREDRWKEDVSTLLKRLEIAIDADEDRQARQVSASVEWKRKDHPDTSPRRWVVYVDNHSDSPINIKQVKVLSNASEFQIDWGPVAPQSTSDYELSETDYDPSGDRPDLKVLFNDVRGVKWLLHQGKLTRRLR